MEKKGKIVQLHADDRGAYSPEPASYKELIVDLESLSRWFSSMLSFKYKYSTISVYYLWQLCIICWAFYKSQHAIILVFLYC